MKKLKVSEATGAVLDWLVAKCEGIPVALHNTGAIYLIDTPWADKSRVKWLAEFSPRKHWAQGGPIVEREKIDLFTEKQTYVESWCASIARYQNGMRLVGWRMHQYGATPLTAAMRCYVASKLGDEVEVPKELL